MISAHTEKRKAGDLGPYQIHVDRKTEKHSNKDIDVSRSHLNYDLVGHEKSTSFKKEILDYINENKKSSRAVRKDAVVLQDWIISSDKKFFENLSPEETRNYFETSVEWFQKRYGENNVRFATVHMDESTPHMHLGVVPFTDDYSLSAKKIFNRQELRDVQAELPKFLQQHGFDITRGEENSEKKHLSVKEYKAKQEATKQLVAETTAKELLKGSNYENNPEREKQLAGFVKKSSPVEVTKRLVSSTLAAETSAERKKASALQKENEQLENENKQLKKAQQQIIEQNQSRFVELINDFKQSVRVVLNPYGVDLREYEPVYFYDGVTEPIFLDTCKNLVNQTKEFIAEKLSKPVKLPTDKDYSDGVWHEQEYRPNVAKMISGIAKTTREYAIEHFEEIKKHVANYVETGEKNWKSIIAINPRKVVLEKADRQRNLTAFGEDGAMYDKQTSNFKHWLSGNALHDFTQDKILSDMGSEAPKNFGKEIVVPQQALKRRSRGR